MIYRLPRKQQPVVRVLQGFVALGFVIRGITYIYLPLDLPSTRLISFFIPLWFWGVVWIVAGLLGIFVVAFKPRWFVRTFSLLCSLLAFWVVGYIGGALIYGAEGIGGVGVYGGVLAAEASVVLVLRGIRNP